MGLISIIGISPLRILFGFSKAKSNYKIQHPPKPRQRRGEGGYTIEFVFNFMLYEIIIFIFGLCVGSFLNAVIWRLEKNESVVFEKKDLLPSDEGRCPKGGGVLNNGKNILTTSPPAPSSLPAIAPLRRRQAGSEEGRVGFLARSYCPHCQTILKWHDLAPVFSFLFLRGQCRYCGEKISIQYPIIEIATGLMFLLITNYQFSIFNEFSITQLLNGHWSLAIGHFISLIYWFYISSSLIVIFVYDLKHYIIPDKILFPAIGVALLYRVSEFFLAFDFATLRSGNKILFPELVEGFFLVSPYFIAAIIASAFFLSLVLISKGKWMGLGDVKLAFLMGLILGWPGILVALFLAFFLGALTGLALIFSSLVSFRGEQFSFGENCSPRGGRYTLKSQIPFGPFLIIGTFAVLFWGGQIIDWYLRLLF